MSKKTKKARVLQGCMQVAKAQPEVIQQFCNQTSLPNTAKEHPTITFEQNPNNQSKSKQTIIHADCYACRRLGLG